MNINLHIERLVLVGLPIGHSQDSFVKAAVEAELTRLLLEKGLSHDLQSGVAVPSVRAQTIELTNDSGPAELGHHIAGAVYGGIGK